MTSRIACLVLIAALTSVGALQLQAVAPEPQSDPDTIMVIPDRSTYGRTLPRVLHYTPLVADSVPDTGCTARFRPTRFSDFNADSMPITRGLPTWARTFINSWTQGDIDRTRQKRVDVSFAASPSYTREASFGLGAAVTGLFRIDRHDSLPQPSMFYASVNASLNGFYVFKARGNLHLPDGRSRLNYNVDIYRKSLHFWGVDVDHTLHNPQSQYDRRCASLYAEYLWLANSRLFFGPVANINYTTAHSLRNPEYLDALRHNYFVSGLGLNITYDSRDNTLRPTRGIHTSLRSVVYPSFSSDAGHTFLANRFIFNIYKSLWNGAVLCGDLYAAVNSPRTPWTMREMVASDGIRMRGYYMGSYVGTNQIAAQSELRQHLWDRLGLTAWIGGATLFSSLRHASANWHGQVWLPNYGFGIRFQFKHNLNGRADIGFGRNTGGVLFSVGEAF